MSTEPDSEFLEKAYEFVKRRLDEDETAPAPEGDQYGGSLVEFLGDDEPVGGDEWLITGVIAAGVPQVIAGPPKSHKTFAAEDMAICVAAGIPWLGRPTARGNALILPREDSVRETQRRIWRLMRGHGLTPHDLEGKLRVDSITPFTWQDDEQYTKLVETVAAFRPKLLVVDSLARTNAADESSAKEMAVLLNRMADLALRFDVAILLIHHFVKETKGKTLLQSLRGSGAIGAVMRHLVGVEKKAKERETNTLEFDGNLHPLADPMRITLVDGTNAQGKATLAFRMEVDRKQEDTEEEMVSITSELASGICEKIFDRGTASRKDLRNLGKHDTVDATLKLLARRGLVVEARHGAKKIGWTLTEQGKRYHLEGVLPPIPG